MRIFRTAVICCTAVILVSSPSFANEADIRKNLPTRFPNLPVIDEVSKTPIPGIFEVRINNSELFYSDAKGDYIFQGSLTETRTRENLTEKRLNELSAIKYSDLPMRDAFTIVRGKGERQMTVFSDPNCGFCKRLEADLAKVDNVTVKVFLYPILGADSMTKSQNIWCSADKGKAYQDFMLRSVSPENKSCDTQALTRNVDFGRKVRITGTPTVFFADGSRFPGALSAQEIEKRLSQTR